MDPTAAEDAFDGPRRAPWDKPRGLDAVLRAWRADARIWGNITLDDALEGRAGHSVALAQDLSAGVKSALLGRGIRELYTHQSEALAFARAKKHVVVATPTASGKSLCYNLPVLEALAVDPEARALYLFPTKALARDQEVALRALLTDAGLNHGAITYDGDTPGDARRVARERSGILLTNPDMLHAGILPHHTLWARLFANLRYVVIDELHTYRGIFGSHLANVLRRLFRIAAFHGSSPVVIFASATIGNPKEHATRMLGQAVELVSESGAPTGVRQVLLYNPPVVNAELGIRASSLKTAVALAADLVRAFVPTLVFGGSRNSVEVMLKYMRDKLADDPIDPQTIAGYRSGYLPDSRRRIEAGLRGGQVRCVVATNALELGIDIGSLDAVICVGYPGSIADLWQRFGRSGRRGGTSLALLVASSNPLDQFLARVPRYLLEAPIEQARIDPDNIEILIQHMKCAAFELPFVGGERFGDVPVEASDQALHYLADNRVLHPVYEPNGRMVYHWSTDSYPANNVSLRNVGWDNVVIVDEEHDVTIAELDWRAAHTMLHEQAIYQHEAEQFQVERLDLENRKAFVRKVEPDYYTTAMTHTRISVIDEEEKASVDGTPASALAAQFGEVSVVERVVGYKKIKFHTHENVGYGDVHLPEMQMHTTAFWLKFSESWVTAQPYARPVVIDALRGLSLALHTVAAVGLMSDPRDLGRTLGDGGDDDSAAGKESGQPVGFEPTIFLYDHVPGGIGLSSRLFDERAVLLKRSQRLIATCPCPDGCPACIGPAAGAPASTPGAVTRKGVLLGLLASLGISPH